MQKKIFVIDKAAACESVTSEPEEPEGALRSAAGPQAAPSPDTHGEVAGGPGVAPGARDGFGLTQAVRERFDAKRRTLARRRLRQVGLYLMVRGPRAEVSRLAKLVATVRKWGLQPGRGAARRRVRAKREIRRLVVELMHDLDNPRIHRDAEIQVGILKAAGAADPEREAVREVVRGILSYETEVLQ